MQLGSEFMPTLNEGTLLYMPITLPGLSVTKAAELLQTQDKIIKTFPEVASVFGKAGRANTATDPAPIEMFETVINLKPESEWRPGMTIDKLIAEMDKALQFPGVSQRLDHADQGAHRHAVDRHPHAGRRQGVRHGSGRDRAASPRQIEAVVRRSPARPAPSPNGSSAAITSRSMPDRDAARALRPEIGDVQEVDRHGARRRDR